MSGQELTVRLGLPLHPAIHTILARLCDTVTTGATAAVVTLLICHFSRSVHTSTVSPPALVCSLGTPCYHASVARVREVADVFDGVSQTPVDDLVGTLSSGRSPLFHVHRIPDVRGRVGPDYDYLPICGVDAAPGYQFKTR